MKEMQRMPAESSICWNSVNSRKSTSSSSGSGIDYRHYVDPWDLENYAYLRRHIPDVSQQTQRSCIHERSLRDARAHPEYWHVPSLLREPEYESYPYTQDLYRRPSVRPINDNFYYQTIYEDERTDYAPSFPIYASVLGISRFPMQEKRSNAHSHAIHVDEERYIMKAILPPHLNTYGHLKIDYTNSWNSLNRRIRQ